MESLVTQEASVTNEVSVKLQRKHWLVDMENVPKIWELILPACSEGDTVILFVSDYIGSVKPMTFAKAGTRGVSFQFIDCDTGTSNAMDFQLVTELGRLSVLYPNDEFIIVSGDNGFRAVLRYLAERGVSVSCCNPADMAPKEVLRADPVREEYASRLSEVGLDPSEIPVIVNILCAAMAEPQNARKLSCLNRLRKQYGDLEGRARYSKIKSVVHSVAVDGPLPVVTTKPAPQPAPVVLESVPSIISDADLKDEVLKMLSNLRIPIRSGDVAKVVKAVTQARKAKNKVQSLQATIGAIYVDGSVRQRVINTVKSLV